VPTNVLMVAFVAQEWLKMTMEIVYLYQSVHAMLTALNTKMVTKELKPMDNITASCKNFRINRYILSEIFKNSIWNNEQNILLLRSQGYIVMSCFQLLLFVISNNRASNVEKNGNIKNFVVISDFSIIYC
jgi:hypothetical protein